MEPFLCKGCGQETAHHGNYCAECSAAIMADRLAHPDLYDGMSLEELGL